MGFTPGLNEWGSRRTAETPVQQPRSRPVQGDLAPSLIQRHGDSRELLHGIDFRELPTKGLLFSSCRLGASAPYHSLESIPLHDISGVERGRVELINSGVISVDSRKLTAAREEIAAIGPREMIRRLTRAGELFFNARIETGGVEMSPLEYCHLQSALTGAPVRHCRENMRKIRTTMTNLEHLLARHLQEAQLDLSFEQVMRGDPARLQPRALGAQLPSNSPGVHQLWVPFLPFVPVMLKPGSGDVLSPLRIRNACITAGIPECAISVYYGRGAEMNLTLQRTCGHFMLFGGSETAKPYRDNPRVDVHGPGYSKVVFGADMAPHWRRFLPIIVEGALQNGGRSCINTSVVLAPSPYDREIAHALNLEFAKVKLRSLADPFAQLAVMPDNSGARRLYGAIAERAAAGGGTILEHHAPPIIQYPNCSALLPMVVHFPTPAREAMKWEFLGPVVAVVNSDELRVEGGMKRTLICTALTQDQELISALRKNRKLFVLHNDPHPTTAINQLAPIETNVVRFLFAQPHIADD